MLPLVFHQSRTVGTTQVISMGWVLTASNQTHENPGPSKQLELVTQGQERLDVIVLELTTQK